MSRAFRICAVVLLALGAAPAVAQDTPAPFESDAAIKADFLRELNALADAGKTRTAADLLATRPASPPPSPSPPLRRSRSTASASTGGCARGR